MLICRGVQGESLKILDWGGPFFWLVKQLNMNLVECPPYDGSRRSEGLNYLPFSEAPGNHFHEEGNEAQRTN